MRKYYLLAQVCSLLLSCKIAENAIPGNYIDSKRGDTLIILSDHRYEFKEKLAKGEFGWNTGNWIFKNGSIAFSNTKPSPFVGYSLKREIVDSSAFPLEIQLALYNSSKLIDITDVAVFDHVRSVPPGGFSFVKNKLQLKTPAFDSLSISTGYFPPIGLSKARFEKHKIYRVTIKPADRLYDLDKYSYRVRKNKLLNRQQDMNFRRTDSTMKI